MMLRRAFLTVVFLAVAVSAMGQSYPATQLRNNQLNLLNNNNVLQQQQQQQRELGILGDAITDKLDSLFVDERAALKSWWEGTVEFFQSIPSKVEALLDDYPTPFANFLRFIMIVGGLIMFVGVCAVFGACLTQFCITDCCCYFWIGKRNIAQLPEHRKIFEKKCARRQRRQERERKIAEIVGRDADYDDVELQRKAVGVVPETEDYET